MSDNNKKSLKEIQQLWRRRNRKKLFPGILNRDTTYFFGNLDSVLINQMHYYRSSIFCIVYCFCIIKKIREKGKLVGTKTKTNKQEFQKTL